MAHGSLKNPEPCHLASLCLILYFLLPLGLPAATLLLVGLGLHPIR